MMRAMSRRILSVAAASAMLMGSTVAAAASPPPATAGAQTNPWLTLSMLNPAGATALGGAVAAQPVYQDGTDGSAGVGPIPWPVIAVWLAVIALDIYLIAKGNDNGNGIEISPD